jgi:hypothetical protein
MTLRKISKKAARQYMRGKERMTLQEIVNLAHHCQPDCDPADWTPLMRQRYEALHQLAIDNDILQPPAPRFDA